jgi:HEAT repeat protein
MGDNDISVHLAAGRKLLKYGKEPFLTGLQDRDPRVRNRAAHFLGLLGDPSVQNDLIKVSKDSDPHVRMWAAFSLGKIGNSQALTTLHELSADGEQEIVRSQAKEAIDEIKKKEERQ